MRLTIRSWGTSPESKLPAFWTASLIETDYISCFPGHFHVEFCSPFAFRQQGLRPDVR